TRMMSRSYVRPKLVSKKWTSGMRICRRTMRSTLIPIARADTFLLPLLFRIPRPPAPRESAPRTAHLTRPEFHGPVAGRAVVPRRYRAAQRLVLVAPDARTVCENTNPLRAVIGSTILQRGDLSEGRRGGDCLSFRTGCARSGE